VRDDHHRVESLTSDLVVEKRRSSIAPLVSSAQAPSPEPQEPIGQSNFVFQDFDIEVGRLGEVI